MIKNISMKCIGSVFLTLIFFVTGCGYTTSSLLPTNFKSIYIDNFKNSIKVTQDTDDLRMYRGYKPGMEIELTNAVSNRFVLDGNLKIAIESNADLILKGELIDYRRERLRYDANYNIDEYRVKIVVNLELYDVKGKKVVWQELSFTGETTYRTGGSLIKTESAAISDAMLDLAKRIVERTIQAW